MYKLEKCMQSSRTKNWGCFLWVKKDWTQELVWVILRYSVNE